VNKFCRADEIARRGLCLGCGVCAIACPNGAIEIVDVPDEGLRPIVSEKQCAACSSCTKVCPGIALEHDKPAPESIPELLDEWGQILEIWEGYASDADMRFRASSGGVASALATFAIETGRCSAVLQTGVNPSSPLCNIPVLSRNKSEILSCAGSRYSPAAPCCGLKMIEKTGCTNVFVGKPCDVAGLKKYAKESKSVSENGIFTISIFCAGTPNTNGTYEVLRKMNVPPEQVEQMRYRGYGWPGETTVRVKGSAQEFKLGYEETWGNILSNHSQFRCYLCPDGTGEFADVSCGDAWHRKDQSTDGGVSLILVRTEKGREFLREALKSGHVVARQTEPGVLSCSQPSLLRRRRVLAGRMKVLRLLGVAVPNLIGFSLDKCWARLGTRQQISTIMRGFRRACIRKSRRSRSYVIKSS
jgi:coenzyme F420 hydrogenase subunit beta